MGFKIAVIGCGNIGTQFACVCAARDHEVTVYSSKADKLNHQLEMVDESGNLTIGEVARTTNNMKDALKNSEIVFVTHPAFLLQKTADSMLPYVKPGLKICVVPGTGGAEFAFHSCIKAGASLYGLQRVPSVARLEEYGRRVRAEGLRDRLFMASIPKDSVCDMTGLMEELFGIPCEAMPNYLNVTLTPSNQILHTTRLRVLFSNYKDGVFYHKNPLFYGDWDNPSSELLLTCDDEIQMLCRLLSPFNLSYVKSVKDHYGSDTVEEMTKKIKSIKSLQKLPSPMVETKNGWIPDFESRYFKADFPYGLAILEEFADLLNYNAVGIKSTMDWYRTMTGNCNQFQLRDYDVKTIEDLKEIYG